MRLGQVVVMGLIKRLVMLSLLMKHGRIERPDIGRCRRNCKQIALAHGPDAGFEMLLLQLAVVRYGAHVRRAIGIGRSSSGSHSCSRRGQVLLLKVVLLLLLVALVVICSCLIDTAAI